ncbi:hypothetical protein [Mesorhizobium sp.]|uniref:hypothetical protein n=1 Tax=Mesorhizobium sp. TaxID=1871066 RepID=UPI0011F4D095|nr:hypothetical protein [Mesorhizobium sp.]TIN82205.1 MAG: hypothetical protein E5X97_31260 [Mesorhizobium sp.]
MTAYHDEDENELAAARKAVDETARYSLLRDAAMDATRKCMAAWASGEPAHRVEDMINAVEKLQSLVDPIHMKDDPALASVPAPSGAEPVAIPQWYREHIGQAKTDAQLEEELLSRAAKAVDTLTDDNWHTEAAVIRDLAAALATPTQAAPAEDIAGIVDGKIEAAVAAERERCRQIAEDYSTIPFQSEAENLLAGLIADKIAGTR